MLNRRSTKIKRTKNLTEQKQDDLQNPRTSSKIWKKITLLDMHICIYICIFICMIYIYNIYIYIYIYIYSYTYMYMYIYIICVYKIYVYMIICVTIYFSHAIHDQFLTSLIDLFPLFDLKQITL